MNSMQHCNTLLLLLSVSCLFADKTASVSILIPPQSLNSSLGSDANFTCEVREALNIFWTINAKNTILLDKVTDKLFVSGNETLTSVLTIPSSLEFNNSIILCHAVSSSVMISDPAHLLIQGPLNQVGNLTHEIKDGTKVAVTWTPPYTLDNVPISNYTLTLTGTYSGYHLSYSIADPSTLLNLPDLCDQYQVTIVPNNAAGPGENETVTVYQLKATQIVPESVLVMLSVPSAGTKPVAEIALNVTHLCAVPLRHTLKVSLTEGTPPISYGPFLTATTNEVINFILDKLEYDTFYTVGIWDETVGGVSNTITIEISTYDVQNATASSDSEGVLCVTCKFIEGSNAGGCVIELTMDGKADYTSVHLSRKPDESEVTGCVRGLLLGEYDIEVFDVEKGGVKSPGAYPAIVINSVFLTRSPVPSPSNDNTSRFPLIPETRGTEFTTPTQVANDRESVSVARESVYRNSAIAVGVVIIVVIIVLLILIVFQVKRLKRQRKCWKTGAIRESNVEIRANQRRSSSDNIDVEVPSTPSPIVEAISVDAEAPPPPPPPPLQPVFTPQQSISPSTSIEKTSSFRTSDLPSPGAGSTTSLVRLERRTSGEHSSINSRPTEGNGREEQSLPSRRRSSSLRSTGVLTAWSAVNPLTLPVLPEAPPPYDEIANETNRYHRPQSALIIPQRSTSSDSGVVSDWFTRQQSNSRSTEYVQLQFGSSVGEISRTYPHRLSAPVAGVQYAIISRYGVYVSHNGRSGSVTDSLV